MTVATAPDGTRIAYHVHGDGPLTVILHPGGGFSSDTWHEILPFLTGAGVRLVALDPRGTGASDRPGQGYTTQGLGADVIAVADDLGAATFALIGHSMGGKIIQYVSCTWPNRVLGQALIVSSPSEPLPAPPAFEALVRRLPGSWEAFTQLHAMSSTMPLPDDVCARMKADFLRTDPEAYGAMLEAIALGGTFTDDLVHTTAPTLAIATDDPATPIEFVTLCASRIPGATVAHLPGPGHWPQYVMPRELACVLRAFLVGLG